jgi:hypothetical protein
VKFTVEEDVRFATEPLGRREDAHFRKRKKVLIPAARFPKSFTPAGETKEQTRARRGEFRKPQRAAAERRRRAEKRAVDEAKRVRASGLECRREAILTVLSEGRWLSARDIVRLVSASLAFSRSGRKPLKPDSLRRIIARELEKPALACVVEKKMIWYKNAEVAQFRLRQGPLIPPGRRVLPSD